MWGAGGEPNASASEASGDGQQGRTRARAVLLQEAPQRDATEELQPPTAGNDDCPTAGCVWRQAWRDGKLRQAKIFAGTDAMVTGLVAATIGRPDKCFLLPRKARNQVLQRPPLFAATTFGWAQRAAALQAVDEGVMRYLSYDEGRNEHRGASSWWARDEF
ncbi:hypothetical protein TRIUR3_24311 [Triticum urartu]|uniref:Uncharacterized protein n=1 Tax=Triticum urartu TaxID=4572 RepID=M7Z375_TRIUA|nr:hypothetical protein TRIUR3_24311 [Triticum urartu]